MIKAIVIEDELYNLHEICSLIEQTGFITVKGKYVNPLHALEHAQSTRPQIAFVDIELPEMDGITLAEKLKEINPNIIIVFITAYYQYAEQVFNINALDFIIKPIQNERFNIMVERIKKRVKEKPILNSSELPIRLFNRQDLK